MIRKAIHNLLPPGKWIGSPKFQQKLALLEEETKKIIDKVDIQFKVDFLQPTKVNAKWSRLLDIPQTEIESKLRQEKGAYHSYFSQFLTDGIEIEVVSLFRVKIKNIKSEGFKAGDSIGNIQALPIIEFLEEIKPAYVSFEYYNESNGRIA